MFKARWKCLPQKIHQGSNTAVEGYVKEKENYIIISGFHCVFLKVNLLSDIFHRCPTASSTHLNIES